MVMTVEQLRAVSQWVELAADKPGALVHVTDAFKTGGVKVSLVDNPSKFASFDRSGGRVS